MINEKWHAAHPMKMGSHLADRVRWHVAHARACGCRDLPPTIVAELKRLGRPIPERKTTASRIVRRRRSSTA